MVYTVTYRYYEEHKSLEYSTLKDAEAKIKKMNGDTAYSHMQILVPLDSFIDYKDRFEELYDFVLKGAGVRKAEVNKVMI